MYIARVYVIKMYSAGSMKPEHKPSKYFVCGPTVEGLQHQLETETRLLHVATSLPDKGVRLIPVLTTAVRLLLLRAAK